MKIYRQNWYFFGIIIFIALTFFMGFWGHMFSHMQTILIFSYMALLIHQFEEYGLPGGFPALFNVVMNGEKEAPDRFPQNSNLAMVVNVCFAYPLYISAILLPDLIWLGLATMFFGLMQVLAHGIMMNVRMKSFYNPGMAACIFLHTPIGIYYIWYVNNNGLAGTLDFIFGGIVMILSAVISIGIPIKFFSSRKTKYPFSQAEMERFGMKEKIKKLDGTSSFKFFQK